MEARDPELTRELNATIHTRKELGQEYEEELIASFLEKVDKRLETVVDKRIRRQLAEQQMVVARGNARPQSAGSPSYPEGMGARLLGGVSLVLAIPLSAIAVANSGLAGLAVCWVGIVAVNVAQASRSWFHFGQQPKDTKRDSDWD